MKCKICEQRKPRRYCPGVTGDICSICCGNEREQTIDCPLDCPHLQDAHDHERPLEIEPDKMPNRDIRLPEDFAQDNVTLMHLALALIYRGALDTPGALDSDVGEAIEGVIRTLRTLESGLYYDSRPENPVAASIYREIREDLDELRRHMVENSFRIPDAQLVATFVYLQREALYRNNGRRKCRAFLDILHRMFPEAKPTESAVPLIIT
ncbi:MAG: hypothetical protein ACR2NN_02870 [Bryobacteraceae bacterium]